MGPRGHRDIDEPAPLAPRSGRRRHRRPDAVADAVVSARILVVDDDMTVADVVTRYLEREGFEVETVGDGLDALAAAAARPPDLVVLDLMLPSVDGLEVCRRLQALAPIPVVMLTAKGDESDRVLGLELGADD